MSSPGGHALAIPWLISDVWQVISWQVNSSSLLLRLCLCCYNDHDFMLILVLTTFSVCDSHYCQTLAGRELILLTQSMLLDFITELTSKQVDHPSYDCKCILSISSSNFLCWEQIWSCLIYTTFLVRIPAHTLGIKNNICAQDCNMTMHKPAFIK